MSTVTVLPASDPGLAGALAQVHTALDRIDGFADSSLAVAGPAAASAVLREIDRATNRLTAWRLKVVAQADKANVAAATGASGTSAWLATTTRTGGGSAAGQVALAAALDEGLPATAKAMQSGAVSTAHAAIIVGAMRDLPEGLSNAQRATIESALVREARHVNPARLKRSASRALAAAQLSADVVAAHQQELLRSQEERAWESATLTLHDHGDGTTSGHFRVPTLAGAILRKVIQQMVSPRRVGNQPDGRSAWAGVDWATRRGQALVQLLEHLPTDHLRGKAAAEVIVTIDHDRLRDRLGAAHLDTGHDLSASDARRLACQAGILPAVLGGTSQILDLGRRRRYFSHAQSTALATMYDECAIEGCDRPYAWTELHHEDPWVRDRGRTDLDKAVPACGQHHRMMHNPRYAHTIRTSPNGRKRVTLHLRR